MSAVVMVIVGLRSSGRSIVHVHGVYGEANRLTPSAPIGCLVNLRDGQENAFCNPGLSIDNPGCHPHTRDKE